MLKTELHAHCQGDPEHYLPHTAKQLIDQAHKQNFDVLAITCHNRVIYNQ